MARPAAKRSVCGVVTRSLRTGSDEAKWLNGLDIAQEHLAHRNQLGKAAEDAQGATGAHLAISDDWTGAHGRQHDAPFSARQAPTGGLRSESRCSETTRR